MSKENENNILIIVAARLARRECLTRLHYLCDLEQRVVSTRNVRDAVEHAEEAITRECSKIVRGHDMLAKKLRDAESEAAELQEQVRALAAEANYLRNEIKQHSTSVHFCEVCGKDDPCKTDDVCCSLNHPLPATDAVLREIRAQAVEEFCDLIKGYGKVEPDYFNPYFADLYAKIYKGIYESILDNPPVHDMESLVDWLEAGASNSRAYADMAIKYAAIRSGEQQ